jgi:hypothetical protein
MDVAEEIISTAAFETVKKNSSVDDSETTRLKKLLKLDSSKYVLRGLAFNGSSEEQGETGTMFQRKFAPISS